MYLLATLLLSAPGWPVIFDCGISRSLQWAGYTIVFFLAVYNEIGVSFCCAIHHLSLYFFCRSFMFFSVLCLACLCARLLICALWSAAWKGLTAWLSFVVSNCEFGTFPLVSWVRLGQVWYLVV